MPEVKIANSLPACPVETTLTLISNKWTGFDTARFNDRYKEIR